MFKILKYKMEQVFSSIFFVEVIVSDYVHESILNFLINEKSSKFLIPLNHFIWFYHSYFIFVNFYSLSTGIKEALYWNFY